ncbi:hypothetical protein GO013_12570 [Pseudodesulfovibrio sp. JC047]|uniref:hypothetical protein n=1 Tax=Pseudodesulfovibrio sp. JC047 TaxID=2683199 RepID=UPI0013CF7275|nr:hypothetical protein [Pseudodesulfovibrio sp. JC047]NDV20245.1 hypothetical protein [Pseudodesulfovibrio sp. JC047]
MIRIRRYLGRGVPQEDIDKIIEVVDTSDMRDMDAFVEAIEVVHGIYQKHGAGKIMRTIGTGQGI